MLPGGFVPNLGEYQTARMMGMVASDQVVWLGAELPKRQVIIGFVAGWPACRHCIFFSPLGIIRTMKEKYQMILVRDGLMG